MTAKAFMCTPQSKTAHEYDLLTPDLRPRATCGYRPTQWIQDLVPAASIDSGYVLKTKKAPVYCPKCLAH